MKYPLTYFIILVTASALYSQACCTAGTPLLSSIEMSTSKKGVWQIGLTYEFNNLTDVLSGSELFKDDTRKRITNSVLMEISYGISNRFSITGLFSYVNQIRRINPKVGEENELNTKGIGDAVFLLKYNLISLDIVSQQELAFGLGGKVPLGNSGIKSNGILIPADMHPGTGSYDAIFWAYYSKGFIPAVPVNIFINTSYRLNGSNNRFQDGNAYRFGDEFILNAGAGYRTDTPFDFTLFFRYRNTERDEFADSKVDNTGGDWLYAVPGINIKFLNSFIARLNGQIPLYRKVIGTQLTTTYTTSFSLFYEFGAAKQLSF